MKLIKTLKLKEYTIESHGNITYVTTVIAKDESEAWHKYREGGGDCEERDYNEADSYIIHEEKVLNYVRNKKVVEYMRNE